MTAPSDKNISGWHYLGRTSSSNSIDIKKFWWSLVAQEWMECPDSNISRFNFSPEAMRRFGWTYLDVATSDDLGII